MGAQIAGEKSAAFFAHIAAADDRLQDRGIRGRAADAVAFQHLDQARFIEARRRLALMGFGVDLQEAQAVCFLEQRKLLPFIFASRTPFHPAAS